MKKLALFGLAGLLGISPSFAADFSTGASAIDWTGFYAGLLVGYGPGQAHSDFSGTTTDTDLTGAIAGLTLGANAQMDQFVLGIEGDVAWSGITGSTTCPMPIYECGGDISWSGSLRARAGYALDSALIYGTAGIAFADSTATIDPIPPGLSGEHQDFMVGWTVGAGVEMALSGPVSAKLEYAYSDYGSTNVPAGTIASIPGTIDVYTHAVKFGLNYRF